VVRSPDYAVPGFHYLHPAFIPFMLQTQQSGSVHCRCLVAAVITLTVQLEAASLLQNCSDIQIALLQVDTRFEKRAAISHLRGTQNKSSANISQSKRSQRSTSLDVKDNGASKIAADQVSLLSNVALSHAKLSSNHKQLISGQLAVGSSFGDTLRDLGLVVLVSALCVSAMIGYQWHRGKTDLYHSFVVAALWQTVVILAAVLMYLTASLIDIPPALVVFVLGTIFNCIIHCEGPDAPLMLAGSSRHL